ncbi:prolyl oligopeptidase family serine peptidase [Rheinheimera sp. 1928-s]|uniref:alpha/beta hydrolase family protein n=1 Tax=Rheinheimera sp. 1928-s TaxID=3033803 RepID=UPI0026215E29|nr:prolyl oligopeptidase family serine peptidase [Rheinheimera sp. 1928-s]MDF3124193.1 prolyl oligopeptidase family serine peptidase [Rheinheimera sp. 1928-s]
MKTSMLFILLIAGVHLPALAEATSTAPKAKAPAQTELFSTAASLQKSRSCFGGPFQSYDSYIAFRLKMAKKQPNFSEAKLRAQLPQADYEGFIQTLDCQDFVYRVGDVPVRGFMIKPKQISGKAPVVIYNRGGNAGYGQLVFGFVMHELMPIAAQGFVVIASNYRGQHNWGKAAVSNAGFDEFGGAELEDVKALVPIAQGMKDVDANRMAMWGQSRGGMMTYMLAKSMPELKTIVVAAGATDLAKELEIRPAMEKVFEARIPNYSSNKVAALAERSVLLWPEQLPADMPILIQHGDQDKQVSVRNAEQLALKLKELNHPHQLLIYPGADHGFNPVRAKARQDMINWLKQYLG